MNIAIDARGSYLYHGTGIGTYTNNLISELIDLGPNNKFTLFCSGKMSSKYMRKNTNIILSSGKHGGFYENYYFPKYLSKVNSDLYHIPQNGIGFNLDMNIKTIVTIHDLIPYIMPETVGTGYLKRFLTDMPSIIDKAAGIITVSEYSKKDILKFFSFYPEDKIIVTQLAANPIFKPMDKVYCKKYIENITKTKGPFILYLGGFSSRKNVLVLIKSFIDSYKSLNKEYKLLLCGSLKDEGQKLYEFVKSKNMDDKIIFPGYIEENMLPLIYNGCNALIYPSLYEGFGLPPLEAMSCKTPVITSSTSSIPEVTSNCALLINPNDADELSNSIVCLLNDINLQNNLSENGYKRSLKFSWKNTAKKTLAAYKYFSENNE